MADIIATNPAVSSLLETAVSYDGCQSIQSDSERTIQTDSKRRTCICHIGDACQIMSTAYNSIKDPRGCFILVPSYEVQLREAYWRHLRPNSSDEDMDQIDEFAVAVHHFHPTVIDRCFHTDMEDRQEERTLPMPARTTNERSFEALEYLLDDKDKVVNHQTGAPTGEYWIVPSYSFDAAHGDLKQSMGNMPQLDLERCIRRMKREARRQKWEAIVDKWEAVSKRSLRSEATRATAALTVPSSPSPSTSSSVMNPPSVILQAPPLAEIRGNMHSIDSPAKPMVDDLDVVHGKLDGPKTKMVDNLEIVHDKLLYGMGGHKREEDEPPFEKRGSMMTAQEVLESELGDDDDTITLHTVDEPPEDLDEPKAEETQEPSTREQQDDGSMSSLSNEGSATVEDRGSKTVEVPPKPASPGSTLAQGAVSNPDSLEQQQQRQKQQMLALAQQLSAISKSDDQRKPWEGKLVAKKNSALQKQVNPQQIDVTDATSVSTLQDQQSLSKAEEKATSTSCTVSTKSESKTKSNTSFLKSRAGSVVAIALYCIFIAKMIMFVNDCTSVLRSREEALA